uniref:ATPase PAAT isoform X2 n=1 Tax=Myxine glutinosa TaxID=7769 RepID=UPI0035901737
MAMPAVMCSWEVAPGENLLDTLSTTSDHVVHAPRSKPVTLHQPSSSTSSGCILSLHSDKGDIMGISLDSEARIVELYVNHEYLSTKRGTRSCATGGEDLMFNIDVQLETSQPSCDLKLLSLPKKNTVTINSLVLRIKERDNTPGVAFNDICDFRSGPSALDLRKVQEMVETMGKTLSPKAEKLLALLQSQQQRGQAQGPSYLSSAASIDSSCVSLLRMLLKHGDTSPPRCPFPIPERTGRNINFGTCEKMKVHSEMENCGCLPAPRMTSTNATSSVVDGGRRVDFSVVEDDEVICDGNPGGCAKYRCDTQERSLKIVGSTDGEDCDHQNGSGSATVPQCSLGSNGEEKVLAQVQKMTTQLERIEKSFFHCPKRTRLPLIAYH